MLISFRKILTTLSVIVICFASTTYAIDQIDPTTDEEIVNTSEEDEEAEEPLKQNEFNQQLNPLQILQLPLPPSINNNNNSIFRNLEREHKDCESAQVIALNKITAKSQILTMKAGQSQYFGNIKISIHKCIKDLDPYKPDNYILLSVHESKIDEDPIPLFSGWMLSSTVSLSTFEHPVYEIFAKECL